MNVTQSGAVGEVIVTQAGQESTVTVVTAGAQEAAVTVVTARGPAGASVTVDQTIIDGSVNAVSGNAVFDALALKAPLANPTFTGIVTAPRITGRCDGLEVLCKAGLAINAGQVVYVTGASGNNIIIGLARANAEATSSKTIGISESTLAHNATGYVITEGLMTVSISAPTANEGDPIWLSPTTAGGMVFGLANKPSAPNHIVYLGVVTRKTGNTVVEIYVKVQNGAELDELSDVAITSPVAGQALMRGATLWENRLLTSADISDATSAATANTLVLRDATGGSNFAAVGASSVTSSGGISTTGFAANIYTEGQLGFISTSGVNADIYTEGSDAKIYTAGANAYIQSRSTFQLYNGTYTTTLSHAPTANRAIAFPNKAGTVAMTSDITGTNSGTNTGDETGARIASLITAATSKTTPVDADEIPITDSAASFGLKKLTFTNLKAFLKTYLDTLYVALTGAQTIAGNKTFSGQTELTGQAATNDTSAMTRALADTRYGQQLFVSQSTAETSAANTTTYVSSTQCTLALAVGTYRVEAWIQVEGLGSTGSAKGQLNFTGTATGSSIIFLAGGSPTVYLQNAVPVLSQNGGRVFNSSVAFNYSSNRGGVMHLRFNLTVTAAGTLAIQYAPAVAVALQTAEISVGSFISARKIA